jgi:hypothetical protein
MALLLKEHIMKQGNLEFDQDLGANALEIQMAVEQAKANISVDSLPEPAVDPNDFGLAIPQDFFERQMQAFEAQYRQLQPEEFDDSAQIEEETFDIQEALFNSLQPNASVLEEVISEQGAETTDSLEMPEPESLEQIIEAEEMPPGEVMDNGMPGSNDYLMPQELLEGQMAETNQPMEPADQYPDLSQLGYGMMPQEMYEEQMMYGMDPLMMPYGPMPFDPMMGPGPGGP